MQRNNIKFPLICRALADGTYDAPKLESTEITQIIEEDKKYGVFKPANGKHFTYKVLNEDSEITNKQVLDMIKYSHRRIEIRTNLKFKPARAGETVDFRIEFRTVDTDPDKQLTNNTLMYHYFPISSLINPYRGLCVVNKSYFWTSHGMDLPLNVIDPTNYPKPTTWRGSTYDFDQVYTHEKLHGLGLPHSKSAGHVMSSNYGIMAEYLSSEDIARLVAKYGSRGLSDHFIGRWLKWLRHASDR